MRNIAPQGRGKQIISKRVIGYKEEKHYTTGQGKTDYQRTGDRLHGRETLYHRAGENRLLANG